ncbi:MAG: DUF935 domain-containing protein [Tannerella sp.]|jgi:hypothetical protein|nr:DUF935 domain-containing protein [Tannerella sp.]
MAKKKQQQGKQVVALIEQSTPGRATKTIQTWKTAIAAFENPQNPMRKQLYDLYDDIMLDGQIEATWGKRRDAVLNRRLLFVRDEQKDETVTKLLNSPDMRRLIEELHKTIAYGYTLIQVNDIWYDEEQECYRIDFDLIPRANVHPEPEFECISKAASSITGDWLYMNPPLANYMLGAGNYSDKGLFAKAAPYVIYKRGTMGDWSQFSEMFGMPFREAMYDAFDDQTRIKIEQMLNNWGAGMSMVHPKSVEIKLHETGGSTSSSDVYDKFIEICDAGISKTILGNTLTTEQGDNGARSLGEVHQAEEDDKKKSDELFILSVLNAQFRSILKRFGINAKGGEIRYEKPDKDWDTLKKKWNVIGAVKAAVPVDDDYIYEEFDIPKPDDYEQRKEEMRSHPQTPPPTGEQLSAEFDFFA